MTGPVFRTLIRLASPTSVALSSHSHRLSHSHLSTSLTFTTQSPPRLRASRRKLCLVSVPPVVDRRPRPCSPPSVSSRPCWLRCGTPSLHPPPLRASSVSSSSVVALVLAPSSAGSALLVPEPCSCGHPLLASGLPLQRWNGPNPSLTADFCSTSGLLQCRGEVFFFLKLFYVTFFGLAFCCFNVGLEETN
ncbi:uncharacterized protein DS421_18g612000 [Arachis hypogaea]|nr:uncharacterized protein DS421_18g612000 [Arachis hypogaea]